MGTSQPRCPTCHKFGTLALGGYCKVCVPTDKDRDHINRDEYKPNYGTRQGSFFPETYGVENDTYPIDRR